MVCNCTCNWCSAQFEGVRKGQKYCSQACKSAMGNQVKRLKNAAMVPDRFPSEMTLLERMSRCNQELSDD